MNLSALYKNILLPAAIFQSVIIGGGYGTGREVVEYVSRHGLFGGFVALLAIAAGFSLVLSISFALAVRFTITDYRHFLMVLLGRGWIAYELLLIVLLIVVIAVVGAAAAEIAVQAFAVPYVAGVAVVLILISALNYCGRALVPPLLAIWSVLLTLAAIAFVLVASAAVNPASNGADGWTSPVSTSFVSGIQFAIYNSALIPVLIYATASINTVKLGFISGLVAGIVGALPALLLHLVFSPWSPQIFEQSVPTYWVMAQLELDAYSMVYFVVLFGTVVLTGAGILLGVNERLDGWRTEHGHPPLSPLTHGTIAAVIVLLSFALAQMGIVALVATAYGTLAWMFLLVFTLPLLTRGIYLLLSKEEKACLTK